MNYLESFNEFDAVNLLIKVYTNVFEGKIILIEVLIINLMRLN